MNYDNMTLLIDTFSYNGEPIAELRLQHLSPVVDLFLVVEAKQTHSGVEKEFLYTEKYADLFRLYGDKVRILIIDKFPTMPEDWVENNAESYMNPASCESWYREQYQRDYVQQYLREYMKHEDYVLIVSDVDEIMNVHVASELKKKYFALRDPVFLEMEFFYYNFQWKKPSLWYHAYIINDLGLRNHTLSYYRTRALKTRFIRDAGWHASYFLNKSDLTRKLTSFAHRECDKEDFKKEAFLTKCIQEGKDIAERGPSEDCILVSLQGLPIDFQHFHYKVIFLQRYA